MYVQLFIPKIIWAVLHKKISIMKPDDIVTKRRHQLGNIQLHPRQLESECLEINNILQIQSQYSSKEVAISAIYEKAGGCKSFVAKRK